MTLTSKPAEIKNIIDRALERNSENKAIIEAFAPIIIKQREWAAQSSLQKLDCSLIDKGKLKAGVPVIRQISLLLADDSLKEISLSLAAAIKEGMPKLTESIDKISDLIKEGKINPDDYLKESSDVEKKSVESNALFLMSLVSRVVLEQRAREITSTLGSFDWDKGYCPICGDFPSIALIEEGGGKRFLHCSSCGQDWRYTRISCPYCEKETRQDMEYFYIENKTQEAAFVCDKCKKYLVTLYRAGKLFARDMDISAISLIHMDILMQGKGYEPMTVNLWNVLS